ncbi:hypothetical protein [Streptomyces sp. DH12]|uniref:hypothetical protein n=1 Tax=Streptomyces sp. DH12 TaxID=2857010 RepID=UPI001E5E7140|nr:hypothetical protein [Streptomyces sp. DH12]
MAVALVAGLILGAVGVGAAWALRGDDGSTAGGAAGDARHACDALEGFDESEVLTRGAKGEVAVNRLAAAVALSTAAAAGDGEFKPLSEALRRVRDQHARFADFSEPEVQKDLKAARSLCADL